MSAFSVSASDLGAVLDIGETTHVARRAGQVNARHRVNLAYMDGHAKSTNWMVFSPIDCSWF
ncbi:hypothetical protein PQO03_12585 [Lentisphaera profundi]|uniref:Uncharacterized protein n=1 Tax=Lentisphaera profundi TaxID=1658616 RepID=A0ABY7VY00_9BACT|nr:hypothetical protein [Lentisphaera profundi]WDE98674.1 hypothetical protein PQO03_12585 [Lentisphaera profundi]